MRTPVRASDRDLRALAAIVSQNRDDLPPDGLPPSLLADLMDQIRCDVIGFVHMDSGRQKTTILQAAIPGVPAERPAFPCMSDVLDPVHWTHYWECLPCSHPDRTGDLCSVLKIADYYSARQWHSTGMYSDIYRPQDLQHELMLTLPAASGLVPGPGRTVRLFIYRGSGRDFSERDRAVLTLLRPHLHQAFLDAERRRHPVSRLTPRQNDLLRLVAAGHTNAQIARRLGISEGTVRTHLEHIYEKLHVSSRAAAVTCAFSGRVA